MISSTFLKYAALFFILIMPFLFNKDNAESPFELFKLSFSTLYIVPLFILFLIKTLKEEEILLKWNKALAFLGLIFLSSIFSYFVSINPYLSFWGDNLLPSDSLRSIVVFFLYAYLLSQLFVDLKEIKKIIYTLLIVVSVSVLHGFLQANLLDPTWSSVYKLVYGTIGNTGGYASFLGALSPFVLVIIFTTKNKLLKYCLFLLFVFINVCLLHTGARAPITVNTFISILIFLCSFQKEKYIIFLKRSVVVIILLLTSFLLFKFSSVDKNLMTKMRPNYISKALEIRKLLVLNGVEAWLKKPILGYGPETFGIAQRPEQSAEMNKYQSWEFAWQKAHNDLVQILVCSGLVGLTLHLLLFFYLTFRAIKIFFKSHRADGEYLAFGFYCGYLFLFISNLLAFNFVTTQLYSMIFPVLMLMSLGEVKILKISIPKKIRLFLVVFISVPLVYFFVKSYNYWLADIDYQKARKYFQSEKNNINAIKYNDRAIELNEDEPIYYCHKALVLEKILNKNLNKLSDKDKLSVISEIENNINICTDLGINRDFFIFLKAEIYGHLFFDGIISDPYQSLQTYDQLTKLTPVSPKPYLKRGIIYLRQNKPQKFLEQMWQAIKLKSDYIPAYIELINFYYSVHDLESVHRLAEEINRITFYASEQTEYLSDLVVIAEQNKDIKGKELFLSIVKKYQDFKDIN